ncbi:hypothetical protein U1Q18_009700 [Sarracenia purpurea var. burkii]
MADGVDRDPSYFRVMTKSDPHCFRGQSEIRSSVLLVPLLTVIGEKETHWDRNKIHAAPPPSVVIHDTKAIEIEPKPDSAPEEKPGTRAGNKGRLHDLASRGISWLSDENDQNPPLASEHTELLRPDLRRVRLRSPSYLSSTPQVVADDGVLCLSALGRLYVALVILGFSLLFGLKYYSTLLNCGQLAIPLGSLRSECGDHRTSLRPGGIEGAGEERNILYPLGSGFVGETRSGNADTGARSVVDRSGFHEGGCCDRGSDFQGSVCSCLPSLMAEKETLAAKFQDLPTWVCSGYTRERRVWAVSSNARPEKLNSVTDPGTRGSAGVVDLVSKNVRRPRIRA